MSETFLEKAKYFLARHYLPLVLAFFVGAISVLPSVLAPLAIGNDYKGMPFLYINDEHVYLMRIQEVLDGHTSISSPAYDGFKDTPALQMPFAEYVYAILTIVFGIKAVILLSKVLFPALLFLLIYVFIRQLSESTASEKEKSWNALAGALLVTLGYDFVDFRHIFSLLSHGNESFYLSLWTRLVNPISGALLLFSYLIVLWRFIMTKKRIWILTAILILILMSGYIFSYALVLTISGFLTLISLFQKNYRQAGAFLIVGIVGIFPLVIEVIGLKWSSVFMATGQLSKNGLFFTHEPLINKLLVVATLLFVATSLWYFRKDFIVKMKTKIIDWWWFSVAILAALFVVFNQQIITGMTIWPQHFVQYSIPLIYVIGLLVLFNFIRPHLSYLWKTLVVIIIISTISFGIWSDTTVRVTIENYKALQRYAPLFLWFKENTEKDCVVLAPPNTMGLIPSYTSCNVYYSDYSYFGVPKSRVEHGYMSTLRFKGVSASDIDKYLLSHQDELVEVVFSDWAEKYHTNNDPWVNKLLNQSRFDSWLALEESRMVAKYKLFLKGDFEKELKLYKISYIVTDRQNGQKLPQDMNRFTRQVYQTGEFTVFEVI
ncbi:MAG: hypothetical protein Q7S34_02395 [bacterium]|nr:hypothetical protein [bacterium]